MISNKNLVEQLERLLDENIKKVLIPHVRGNSIRIKDHIVRKSKAGWLVYNAKKNHQIARMFSKTAAVALAKTLAQGRDEFKTINQLDGYIQKHYNDALFARHVMLNTHDEEKRVVSEMKYELAWEKTCEAKDKLEAYIFR